MALYIYHRQSVSHKTTASNRTHCWTGCSLGLLCPPLSLAISARATAAARAAASVAASRAMAPDAALHFCSRAARSPRGWDDRFVASRSFLAMSCSAAVFSCVLLFVVFDTVTPFDIAPTDMIFSNSIFLLDNGYAHDSIVGQIALRSFDRTYVSAVQAPASRENQKCDTKELYGILLMNFAKRFTTETFVL